MTRLSGTGPEDPKAVNLAKIVFRLLTDPRGWRVEDLLAELRIGRRTLRGYRRALGRLEYFRDEEGASLVEQVGRGEMACLRLRESQDGPFEEQPFIGRFAALELARQAFHFLSDTELGQDLSTFCEDFVMRVKDRTYVFRSLLRDSDRKFYYLPWAPKDYAGRGGDLRKILRGLMDGKRLRITYDSERDPGPRLVEPLTLVMWKSGLYLIVRSADKERTYTMAVDRMRTVEPTGESFHYPPKAEFDPARYTEGGFGLFVGDPGQPIRFELVFAANPAIQKDLRERHWHHSEDLTTLDDGRLRMTFTVRTDIEVWPWVRSYGDQVEVVAPHLGPGRLVSIRSIRDLEGA